MGKPLRNAIRSSFQKWAIMQWTFMMLCGALSGLVFSYYLLLTPFFYVMIAYFLWIFYDRNTCKRGGRRSDWVRNWSLWRYVRDYFPITLIKTSELSSNRNYIFGYHPHGILGVGAFCNFATEATNFSQKFKGIVPHVVTIGSYFLFPFQREYFVWTGMCCSSKESFEYILSKKGNGNAVVVVVGGITEALQTKENEMQLYINKRKGFVKLAICHGADLVPVISFGENNTFELNDYKDRFSRLKIKLYTIMGLCPPLLFYICFFIISKARGFLPERTPVTTVVGKPIEVLKDSNPSTETIEHYHKLYVERLEQLYDEYKCKLGIDNNNERLILQ
ncbi:Diacylglycerol O-acyltransferase 2 [Chamberlinius hualienensis]